MKHSAEGACTPPFATARGNGGILALQVRKLTWQSSVTCPSITSLLNDDARIPTQVD